MDDEDHRPRKKLAKGFNWKEKSTTEAVSGSVESRDLDRGYRARDHRDRERERDRYRERDSTHDRERDRYRDDEQAPKSRARSLSPRRNESSRKTSHGDAKVRDENKQVEEPDEEADDLGADVRAKFGDVKPRKIKSNIDGVTNSVEDKFGTANGDSSAKIKKKKDKDGSGSGHVKRPAAPSTQEPMIIVNVNDRLGTKAAIPCLASDPVRLFKAQVAARIGREPHEIMLKRQGERPFKDHLTLEDYGVSSGVQLDLEVDTGD